MKLTIELDREIDGRWIGEVPELNDLIHGNSKQEALQRSQSAATELIMDGIAHGQMPADSAITANDRKKVARSGRSRVRPGKTSP